MASSDTHNHLPTPFADETDHQPQNHLPADPAEGDTTTDRSRTLSQSPPPAAAAGATLLPAPEAEDGALPLDAMTENTNVNGTVVALAGIQNTNLQTLHVDHALNQTNLLFFNLENGDDTAHNHLRSRGTASTKSGVAVRARSTSRCRSDNFFNPEEPQDAITATSSSYKNWVLSGVGKRWPSRIFNGDEH